MKKNIGTTDKIIRYVAAILFGVLYATGVVTGTAGVVMLVLGAVFILTATLDFCPLYAIFGMSTCKTKS
jgi:hypothetical protein